jgi:hypothetical protein
MLRVREGRFRNPDFSKFIGEYDDVNQSSYWPILSLAQAEEPRCNA